MLPSVMKIKLTPDDFAKVQLPVLVIHGTRDRQAPYGGGRDWALRLPDARLLTVANAAHLPWIEAPDKVFGSIKTFLDGIWPDEAHCVSKALNDEEISGTPMVIHTIRDETEKLGFRMASEPKTGALLRALAAAKPGGSFLELGTGTGIGTAWLLAGMDANSKLVSVDNDPRVQAIAQRHLGHDLRVRFDLIDGAEFLSQSHPQFDLIYADAWPGKFSQLDLALSLLRIGGIYFIDDLLPQPNWPEDHAPKVEALIEDLESRSGFVCTKLAWASGLMLLVKTELGMDL
jgi:predicted O-methyltransferase YrrM